MGFNKVITIIGFSVLLVQSISAASIGAPGKACMCTREYTPICGTDDVTYSNTCEFQCVKDEMKSDLEIKFYGECSDDLKPQIEDLNDIELFQDVPECVCTFVFEPVCGSDGKTYSSECEFNCAKRFNRALTSFTQGECVQVKTLPMETVEKMPVEEVEKMQDDGNCFCTFVYDPVCGSDGKTYSSECEFNCAKKFNRALEIFSKGECVQVKTLPMETVEKIDESAACMCTRIYLPVCGSDGKTYSNECNFNCAKKTNNNLAVKFMGECSELNITPFQSESLPSCMCTRNYSPVCGTDNKTYSNECMLKCARENNKNLKIKHMGQC